MHCAFSGMLSSHVTERQTLISEYFHSALKVQPQKSTNKKEARFEVWL